MRSAQEINEMIETVAQSSAFPVLLGELVTSLNHILQEETDVQFFAEHRVQQFRKLLFDIMQRVAQSEHSRPHVKTLLGLCVKFIEVCTSVSLIAYDLLRSFFTYNYEDVRRHTVSKIQP